MQKGFTLKFLFVCLLAFTSKAQTFPIVSINSTTKYNCINTPISFASRIVENNPVREDAPPYLYNWSILPSTGLIQSTSLTAPNITFSFSLATTFTLTLKVNKGEFTIITTTVISIGGIPKASFNATFDNAGYPSQLILTGYSTNSVTNHWQYSDTPKIDSTVNTLKTYTASGNYSVMLVTIGKQGCRDTARYNFYIVDSSGVTLPNFFSPNNDDVNDVYRPIVRGITKLSAKIYNRNAVLIHFWDRPDGFWDGNTNSGEPCTDGEYFIILNATGFDGRTYQLQSHITLVR